MSTVQTQIRPRVLCIDDDAAIVAAISKRLRDYDVEVLTAFFGTQGLWLAATKKPDAIITDLRMPSGNGDYVVECLKRRVDTQRIPVIVLTGKRDHNTRRRMLALGVDRYICKPAPLERVIYALSRFVDIQPRFNSDSHLRSVQPTGGASLRGPATR